MTFSKMNGGQSFFTLWMNPLSFGIDDDCNVAYESI